MTGPRWHKAYVHAQLLVNRVTMSHGARTTALVATATRPPPFSGRGR
jgi:hypothetical protein